MAAETVDKATLDKQAVNVLNHSMWSKKQYYILLGALLVQSFIYAFETNLMYGVIGHVTAIFTSASLTAILPTILQILSASLVPFYSKFADVIGRPGALTIAMTFYVTGYIIQGTSNGFTQFSVGQAFYSIGVPGFMVLTQVLVVDLTTLQNRGIVFALWSMSSGLHIWTTQALIKPFTTEGNWRHAYVIISVLAALGGVIVLIPLWFLHRKNKKDQVAPPSRSLAWFLHEFDSIGAILLTAALSLLLFPLILAGSYDDNWRNPTIIGCLCAGVVALALLVIWEIKFTNRPFMPMRIWTQRTCFGGLMGNLITTIQASINWMYFTIYLVVSRNVDFAGALLLERGYQMAYLVVALITGILMKKYNTSRPFVWIGIALCCIGTGLMIPARHPDSSDFFVVISQTIVGIGGGMSSNAALVSVTGVVHRRDYAIVIGANQLLGSVGAAIAAATAGGIWTQLLPKRLAIHVTGEYDINQAINDPYYVQTLPEPTRSQVVAAYSDSQLVLSIIACSLVVLAGLCTLFMEHVDLTLTQEEQDAKFGGAVDAHDVPIPVVEDIDEKLEIKN
ncbi:hypothetical protein BG005_011430 [Podila minutissima]|nr:hypothetical protein BG005_011430 [Podila minutissima]